jgi:hypothetical protein
LVSTLSARLGLEALIDAYTWRPSRRRPPGRKVLTLVHAMIGGLSHIDHADTLRAGRRRTFSVTNVAIGSGPTGTGAS